MVCSTNCKKWSTFTVSIICLILGVLTTIFWKGLFQNILSHELSVSSTKTKGFAMWEETPIPMYLEFYLFNWTNPEEVRKNPSAKPHFSECGPYTFLEKHYRTNIIFNYNNDTVTYKTKRVWHFLPNRTKGSLDDNITTINPIAMTVANLFKHKPYLVRKGINFFFEEKKVKLSLTKSAREFLFDGYDDPLLKLAHKLNMSGINVPYKKFGWFVERNGSVDYDGIFNMYTGGLDIEKLGVIVRWNYKDRVPFYRENCAIVNGTSGELWYPPRDASQVSLFSPDLCSSLKLHKDGTDMLNGVEGRRYIGMEDNFDNGTKYTDMQCFKTEGVQLLSGVRNVSLCKYGAPAYVSYPHFYLGDNSYLEAVEGLQPDPSKHQVYITLEPETGLPLKVHAVFQINFLLEPIGGIKIYSNVKKTMIPCMWFRQSAELSEPLTDLAKTLLVMPGVGFYTGIGVLSIGLLLLVIFSLISFRKGWKSTEEENRLLNQQAL